MAAPDDITEDSVLHGALRLRQRRSGYRFAEDAVLLAAFAGRPGPSRLAADLGAGCGVVGLILLERGLAERVVALEIQPLLARLAAENGAANGLSARFATLVADLRAPPLASAAIDLLVANPPYLPVTTGKPSPRPERALARHELACTAADVARAAALCLAPEGRVAVIYPAARVDEVEAAMAAEGLAPLRRREVLPGPDRPPSLALLEAGRRGSPRGAAVEPPLVTRDRDGALGGELRALFAGDLSAWARA